MKTFSQLIASLDQTTKTSEKIAALADYFDAATNQDKVWVIALLSGRRPPRGVNTRLLRQWAAELAEIEPWLF